MKLIATIVALLLCSCATTSVTTVEYTPEANSCIQVQANNFWGVSDAFPCFDKDAKIVGFGTTNSSSAATMWSSVANAAIISTTIPLAATYIVK